MDFLIEQAERKLQNVFQNLDTIESKHTRRILSLYKEFSVSQRHFAPSSGYGYDDVGRDTLEKIYAALFAKEQAIVRPQLSSGTHTLSLCFFGVLLPGQHLLYATGSPYDTLQSVIGEGALDKTGTLQEMGVQFSKTDAIVDGRIDEQSVLSAIRENTKLVVFQRSRGYEKRKSLAPGEIDRISRAIHAAHPHIFTMVDNCYGEFCTMEEDMPDLDIIAGSLIKNPGGGLAPTGGYIAGSERAIKRIEMRLTAPGIGRETGSYAASYQPFYQGLFMAPHTVNQALKTAALASCLFEMLGFSCLPSALEERNDITQAIAFKDREALLAFCRAIQGASPIDSFAVPEPWDMPGYQDQVVMAAGTFVSGSSVELSCDAPMRPPYIAYLQGGLSYAHGKIALSAALSSLKEKGLVRF